MPFETQANGNEIEIERAEDAWRYMFDTLTKGEPIEGDTKDALAKSFSEVVEFITNVEGNGATGHFESTLSEILHGVYKREFDDFIETLNIYYEDVRTGQRGRYDLELRLNPTFSFNFDIDYKSRNMQIDATLKIDPRTYRKAVEDMKFRFEILDAAVNP